MTTNPDDFINPVVTNSYSEDENTQFVHKGMGLTKREHIATTLCAAFISTKMQGPITAMAIAMTDSLIMDLNRPVGEIVKQIEKYTADQREAVRRAVEQHNLKQAQSSAQPKESTK